MSLWSTVTGFLRKTAMGLLKPRRLLLLLLIGAGGFYLVYEGKKATRNEEAKFTAFKGADGKFGCKDDAGKIVLPGRYDKDPCAELSDSFFRNIGDDDGRDFGKDWQEAGADWRAIKRDGKWGFINLQFKEVVRPQFEDVEHWPNWGVYAAKLNGKWGYISTQYEGAFIDFIYDDARPFHRVGGQPGPIAAVKRDGKWGYINRLNETVIPFQFDELDEYYYWEHSTDVWKKHLAFHSPSDKLPAVEPPEIQLGNWVKSIPHRVLAENSYSSEDSAAVKGWTWVKVGALWGIIDSTGKFLMHPSKPNNDGSNITCDTVRSRCYYEIETEETKKGFAEFERKSAKLSNKELVDKLLEAARKTGEESSSFLRYRLVQLPLDPKWNCNGDECTPHD